MRHGTSNRRPRSRNNNGGGRRNNQQQRTQVYDSNGPEVRIRGNAHQVAEKYLSLAKDATSAGDTIVAENYYQHAEHYIRIINEFSGSFESKKADNAKNPQEVADDAGNKKTDKQDDLALPASILGDKKDEANKVEEDA